jgi:cysteine desulfuration protein SufE
MSLSDTGPSEGLQNLRDQLETLALFSDRAERIQALIAIGESYVPASADEVPREPLYRVPGCESEVYMASRREGAKLYIRFAVDNPQGISAMALARILEEGLSGEPLDEVAALSEEIVFDIFGRELSMGKSLGLTNMVKMARAAAEKSRAPET